MVDRRSRKIRINTKFLIWCTQPGSSSIIRCRLADISESGAKITTEKALEKDKPVTLEIDIPGENHTIKAIGSIKWHKKDEEMHWGGAKEIHTYGMLLEKAHLPDLHKVFLYIYKHP